MTQSELFKTAVKKAKAGEHQQAQEMLLKLVEANPQHELAWLLLSQLVKDPEDKIIALENALTINPERPQTKARLKKLRQKYRANLSTKDDYSSLANTPIDVIQTHEEAQLTEIEQRLSTGNSNSGLQELASFLHRYSNNQAGWWLMVQYADSTNNKLTALEHVLRLNRSHPEARSHIENIKPTSEHFLQMARLYERLEEWKTAVRYYKRALKSPNNTDRLLAKKHLPHAEDQLKLSNIKYTHPTTTVLRLVIGPTLLYGMLVFVQAGLNPLQASPLLCLSNIALLAGLLLSGGLAHTPNHPWLEKMRETAVFQNKATLRLFSYTLVLLPIFLLILLALLRLITFELDLEALL